MAEGQQTTEPNNDDYDAAFDEFAGETTAAAEPADAEAEDRSDAGDAQEPVAAEDGADDDAGEGEPEPEGADEDPVAAAKREAEEWRHKYQSDQGRQAALQRKIEEQQARLQALEQARQQPRQQGSQQPRQQQGDQGEAPEGSDMSDAEWKALQEDFPEIAKAMEARLAAVSQQYEGRLNQLESRLQPLQDQQIQAALQQEYATLESQHPDYRETVQSNEFREWVTQQPGPVQQLINSDSAADASWLLDAYKRTQAPAQTSQPGADLQARRQRQLQQGRSVSGRNSRATSGGPAADDFDAAFDYYAENS